MALSILAKDSGRNEIKCLKSKGTRTRCHSRAGRNPNTWVPTEVYPREGGGGHDIGSQVVRKPEVGRFIGCWPATVYHCYKMLRLTKQLRDRINAHGVDSYPYEGCGILLGQVEDGNIIAVDIFLVPNSWADEEEKRERFLIRDQDMLQAELAAAEIDADVVGIFHSHPDHPPIASPRDLAWAAWPGYSYLITEVWDRKPGDSRSWQLLDDRSGFVEESIEIGE